jgi:hypothetical protein
MERTFYDQFSDPSYRRVFRLIQQRPEIEEIVKTASMDIEENEKVSNHSFAWPERRLFRIDSPAHAALSKAFMIKQAGAGIPTEVQERCDRALDVFGVNLALLEKTAQPLETDDSEFLLPSIRRLRVQTKEDVKLAADAIRNNLKKMDTRTRAQACTNLVKKAVDLEQPVPPWVLKFAGYTMCNVGELRDWMYARAEATKDPQIRYGFNKLAEELRQLPPLCGDRDELIKVATAIQELDEAAGLEKFYDRKLLDPLSTVFNTEKLADDFVSLAGKQVPLQDMLAVDPEAYKDVFGEDLANEFIDKTSNEIDPERLKIILPTVPLDLQKTLSAQLG